MQAFIQIQMESILQNDWPITYKDQGKVKGRLRKYCGLKETIWDSDLDLSAIRDITRTSGRT